MMSLSQSARVPVIDILVEAGQWPTRARLRQLIERAVEAALTTTKPPLAADSELSLLFTDDAHVQRLNQRYRGKNSATNVLSFPAPPAAPGMFGPLLGDLVLAEETIAREAAAGELAFDDHLAHLIIHGLLHLLDYDHDDDAEASVMEGLETAILDRLGIADPYGGGAG
jgi:probable rRNA maturation factor